MLKDLVPFPRKMNICTDKNVNIISGNYGLSGAHSLMAVFKNSLVIEVVDCLVRSHPFTLLTPSFFYLSHRILKCSSIHQPI